MTASYDVASNFCQAQARGSSRRRAPFSSLPFHADLQLGSRRYVSRSSDVQLGSRGRLSPSWCWLLWGQGLTLAHFRAQLEDLRETSLTLELNLSTFRTHQRLNLGHMRVIASLS